LPAFAAKLFFSHFVDARICIVWPYTPPLCRGASRAAGTGPSMHTGNRRLSRLRYSARTLTGVGDGVGGGGWVEVGVGWMLGPTWSVARDMVPPSGGRETSTCMCNPQTNTREMRHGLHDRGAFAHRRDDWTGNANVSPRVKGGVVVVTGKHAPLPFRDEGRVEQPEPPRRADPALIPRHRGGSHGLLQRLHVRCP
jgi:hypothetical protein